VGWGQGRFARDFLKKPGQHLLEIGQTNMGKTQGLYFLLEGLRVHSPKETIVWVDTGKTSELLALAQFGDLHLLIPEGCDIKIDLYRDIGRTITREYVTDFADVWWHLKPGAINVISISRFIRRHAPYAKAIAKLFQSLIDAAYDYRLPVPLTVFIDEAQFVMPGKAIAYNTTHLRAGLDVAAALFTLRSLRVRIVAATQQYNIINPPARMSFPWLFIRGGTFLTGDQPRLSKFNLLWGALDNTKGYFVDASKSFSDLITDLPFYGDGESFGRVNYFGRLDKPEQETKLEDDPDRGD